MKRIIKILLTLYVSMIVVSCDKNKTEFTYKGDYFINFENASYSYNEAYSDVISVNILLAAASQTNPVTVTLEFLDHDTITAEEGVDYNFLGETSITFEPGEHAKPLEFTYIDNGNTEGDRIITVRIVDNDGGFVNGLPGPDENNRVAEITIVDDDCPFLMENWVGTHKGRELSDYWDQTDDYIFEAGAINDPDKISLIVTGLFQPQLKTDPVNAWGEEWVIGGTVTLILDLTIPSKPKAIIEPQYYGQTVDPSLDNWDYWIFQNSGPGEFSTCNKTLSIPYSISWDADYTPSSWANFTVTFDLKNE